jgi:hypothetical protein
MAELIVHCIPAPGADAAAAAADLSAFLHRADGVESVEVEVEQARLGPMEILAVLQLAKSGADLAKELVSYLKSRHSTVGDIQIEVNGRRVSVTAELPAE